MSREGGLVDREDDERRSLIRAFAKKWPREFYEDRRINEDRQWHEALRLLLPRDTEMYQTGISAFLQNDSDSFSAYKVEDVEDFCSSAQLSSFRKRRSWLEDRRAGRDGSCERVRESSAPLSAAELHRLLLEKVRIKSQLPQ